jgi:predicted small metal-binding protein
MKFRNSEEFTNQELEFSYGQNLYMATVSYTLETVGEYATWEYPAESETEIVDYEIHSVEIHIDGPYQWLAINPDEELEDQIFEEIKKYHKL